MAAEQGLSLVDLDRDGVDTAFREDVLQGLSEPQKAIPARWFYDDEGSELFEEITRLPEYYPTRAETEILTDRCDEFRTIAAASPEEAARSIATSMAAKLGRWPSPPSASMLTRAGPRVSVRSRGSPRTWPLRSASA